MYRVVVSIVIRGDNVQIQRNTVPTSKVLISHVPQERLKRRDIKPSFSERLDPFIGTCLNSLDDLVHECFQLSTISVRLSSTSDGADVDVDPGGGEERL